jgi:hypothetical protein
MLRLIVVRLMISIPIHEKKNATTWLSIGIYAVCFSSKLKTDPFFQLIKREAGM